MHKVLKQIVLNFKHKGAESPKNLKEVESPKKLEVEENLEDLEDKLIINN